MDAHRRRRPLRSFLKRPGDEQRLLLRALAGLLTVRLALWTLPARTTLRIVNGLVVRRLRRRHSEEVAVERIGWAVNKAAHHVPDATCLTQALAAQLLLARYGHESRLCIGVARGGQGGFEAHAWIEVDGRVVVGGGGLDRYSRLPDLAGVLSLK